MLVSFKARWIAAWPDRKLIWLLQAMVAEPERARAAWRSWLDTSTFDAAPFTEIRLMATLSARLGQIDPDELFPTDSLYARLADAGIRSTVILPASIAGSAPNIALHSHTMMQASTGQGRGSSPSDSTPR